MINIKERENCCGCTSCSSICPHNAILMSPDSLGFLYPIVDSSKCVNCGLCDKVCQFHEMYNRYENYNELKAFQFRLYTDTELKKSQSGGAFYAIAKHIINNNGVVYGAAFTSQWKVTHQRATDIKSLQKLRMSKYVQSDLRGVFHLIKQDLKNGLIVLFSGTACQVAGLRAFIPYKLQDKLICIDIICHGVPSPKIWEDYIEFLQQNRESKIINVCFRDKRFGWHGATESFLFENGIEEFRKTNNYLYFKGLSIRESCTKCFYTNLKRVGDITLGDQWGIAKDSKYEDDKGLSLVFINSNKGECFINILKGNGILEKCTINECLQPQLKTPVKKNLQYNIFVKEYKKKGFYYIAKKYGDLGWRYKKEKSIECLKNLIRTLLKK